MRDRLLKRRAAQGLIARLAPIFDRRVGEARLSEVMRERFRLRLRALGELIAQGFRRAPVQRLAAALEQILVGRVLDQRVLEAVFGVRRQALDKRMSASASFSSADCRASSL